MAKTILYNLRQQGTLLNIWQATQIEARFEEIDGTFLLT
jgi:hypothetical protein